MTNAIDNARKALKIWDEADGPGWVDNGQRCIDALRDLLDSLEYEWEHGVSWLEGDARVFMPTEDEWRAGVELQRMNQGYPYPEENYVVRRIKAGEWEKVS